MNFLLACFGVGLLSTVGVGPIFLLTFNRSAIYGFLRGFATALGAAFADGVLFTLGLAGFLSFIGRSKIVYLSLDLLGGFALMYMGYYYYTRTISIKGSEVQEREGLIKILINSFFITLFNPGSMLYFGYMSIQVSENLEEMAFIYYLSGAIAAFAGTLLGFTLVSLVARGLGSIITPKRLEIVSKVTGVLLVIVGTYFLYDFVINGNIMISSLA